MKKTKEKFSYVSLGIGSLGIVMKLFHAPGSNIVLILGAVGVLFIMVPYLLVHLSEIGKVPMKKGLLYTSLIIMFLGICTKLFHVPAANLIIVIGLIGINVIFFKAIRSIKA